jgi:hypothetical protein
LFKDGRNDKPLLPQSESKIGGKDFYLRVVAHFAALGVLQATISLALACPA